MPLKKKLNPRFHRKGHGLLKNAVKMSKGGYLHGIGEKKKNKCANCGKKIEYGMYCDKKCRKEFENAT